MDDQYHTLSLRLYEILDWIGASEEMRGKYREQALVFEIVMSMVSNLYDDEPITLYVLGSSCEGTTTTGLHSDLDILCCLSKPVVEIIYDAPQLGISYLIVTDDTTKSGYCKLQAVLNKDPIHQLDASTGFYCVPDQYGILCLRHLHEINEYYPEIHGPALTRTETFGIPDKDLVFSFRCYHIPSFAKSWVTRITRCNRLNQSQINMLTEFGCFFVGRNHPSSQNGPIEWRLSFSLQERELMSSLNPTQHKCYVLLKMIKKDIIHQRVPESISSYHCKTCVLYAIERTPCELWTRRNLLKCTLLCIKLLLHWVKIQNCPNYFIPNENMFDRLEHNTLRRVQAVIEDMITNWCIFIWSITCDDIGNVMTNVIFGCGPSIMKIKHNTVSKCTLHTYANIINSLRSRTRVSIRKQCKRISASHPIVELLSMQTNILQTDCVRDHTEKETRQAISYFIPHLCLQTAQCIASVMLSTIDTHRLRMLFGWLKYYIEDSQNCDTISAYLIIASFRLQSDRNDICEKNLLQCEKSLKSHVLSLCCCHKAGDIYQNEAFNELVQMLCSQGIPYTEFARTCTAGCLVFLPHQANLVPPALHYEMYRSVSTPPDSKDKDMDFWFDWIVVDSKVYLYFLQYILYSKTNKPINKQSAANKLINVINTDNNLGHKETALNLMGWIFTQENQIQRAMKCFLESLRIRPFHNAAKWHVLELIRSFNSSYSGKHML